jgi:hypothetical protein
MTRDELKADLDALTPGGHFSISYDLFAEIFPPGLQDDAAREACSALADECHCEIGNVPGENKVFFTKQAAPDQSGHRWSLPLSVD